MIDIKKHILICGERNMGKSATIQRLLADFSGTAGGFETRSEAPDENGFHDIYIYPYGRTDLPKTIDNKIGSCNTREREINSGVFENLGVKYLSDRNCDIIVMDEIGFMEENSPEFCNAVLSCLDGDIPVLASVKSRSDIAFLNKVRNHPKAKVFYVLPENRDELYEQIKIEMFSET